MSKKVIIIGSGFSSLSAACYLSRSGFSVSVYEKNDTIGGRARQLKSNGFTFDMGPTFYWMPDVFEKFFADFSQSPSDFYELLRLNPGYEIYFGKGDTLAISADLSQIYHTFEKLEKGSSKVLKKFLNKAEFNYRVAMEKMVHLPGKTPLELINPQTVTRVNQFIYSLRHTVHKHIKNKKLRQLLEFPVLFLGAKSSDIPAFYCFMNYADMVLGTWHIKGGMFKLADAMRKIAESNGAKIHTSANVEKIITENKVVKGVIVNKNFEAADVVISGADYHHTEMLLEEKYRNYTDNYWRKRVMAPSALLYYIGFDKKLENLSHHTLFFDADFEAHAKMIYDAPCWPVKPLFYASFPTITDKTLAPEGKEAAIILIPVAAGLEDTQELRKAYFDQIMARMEKLTQQPLKNHVLFYHSYAVSDFMGDYNAYKGNAYGLSNILLQTAFLKPKIYNKKLKNLFYTGQLTVPGPGVPPALISGKIVANEVEKYIKTMDS